jgi:hypothetical protein
MILRKSKNNLRDKGTDEEGTKAHRDKGTKGKGLSALCLW